MSSRRSRPPFSRIRRGYDPLVSHSPDRRYRCCGCSSGSNGRGWRQFHRFERYFPILLIVTSFATIALLAFIGAVVYRLFKQRRNKVFGSRMTINLALYLSLAAVFPCLLLYFVSSQFIGRSIDSWFDVRVEQALDSGVALSSEVLTREQHQLLQTARRIASILNATSKGERALTLDRMRETSDAASAIVFHLQAKFS